MPDRLVSELRALLKRSKRTSIVSMPESAKKGDDPSTMWIVGPSFVRWSDIQRFTQILDRLEKEDVSKRTP